MSGQNPAEVIRRAEKLIRDRAEAAAHASSPPWRIGAVAPCECCEWIEDSAGSPVCTVDDRQSEHVAGMHPLVGTALADVLDKVAWAVTIDPDLIGRVGYAEVLTLARAYLGEETAS